MCISSTFSLFFIRPVLLNLLNTSGLWASFMSLRRPASGRRCCIVCHLGHLHLEIGDKLLLTRSGWHRRGSCTACPASCCDLLLLAGVIIPKLRTIFFCGVKSFERLTPETVANPEK